MSQVSAAVSIIGGLGVGGLLMHAVQVISAHARTKPIRPATITSTRLYRGRCQLTAPPDVPNKGIDPHPQRKDGQADCRAGRSDQPSTGDDQPSDGHLCHGTA